MHSNAQFTAKWDNGFKLQSADKNFKLKFGGRIQYDVAYINQSDSLTAQFGEITNGAEFRRVRLFNSGTIYSNVKYKLQLDFAAGKIVFKDVYIEFLKIPVVGSIRVGHFKEPFRLGSLTSSKYITFMERSNFESFSEDRNSGMMIRNSYKDNKFAWQLGTFRSSNAVGDSPASNDEINLAARISSLILNNKEKKEFIHLGVGYNYRNPKLDIYTIKVRPEAHLTPKYLSTNIIEDIDRVLLLNLEFAYSRGPFAIQSEYLVANLNSKVNYNLSGYYVFVSYFLTKEQRPYKSSYDGFNRVKPNKNAINNVGKGAWQIALRYSYMDLDDKDLQGGTMNDITLGLNWFLNPAVAIKFNYIYSYMTADNIAHIAQMRFQIDF